MTAPDRERVSDPLAALAERQAAWCITHQEFAWLYGDNGVECLYCLSVETSSVRCKVEPRLLVTREGLKRALMRHGYSVFQSERIANQQFAALSEKP